MASLGHCAAATPETLLEALQEFDAAKLVPYQHGNPRGIITAIDELMGFKSD